MLKRGRPKKVNFLFQLLLNILLDIFNNSNTNIYSLFVL